MMPDMMVLAGESTARGFHLDGYGVFFDVEVPVLRQSMMWSLRTMLDQDQQGATEALTALRRFVATTNGPERASAEAALRRLEAQMPSVRHGRAATATSGSGGGAAPAPRRPPTRPARRGRASTPSCSNDPNKAYTDAVVQGAHRRDGRLLAADGVVDAAERVPDGGRPRQRAPRPAGPAQPVRRGLDLHAAHQGGRPGRVPRPARSTATRPASACRCRSSRGWGLGTSACSREPAPGSLVSKKLCYAS